MIAADALIFDASFLLEVGWRRSSSRRLDGVRVLFPSQETADEQCNDD